jgi:gliding motility-associated-like protein
VTDINGCVDSVNQSAFVVVDPKPFADFEWNPSNPTILVNEVGFTDLSSIGTPMQNWSWTYGDYFLPYAQDTSSLQNPTHLYNNVGNYMVTLGVTNSFGCVDSVSKIVVVEDEFAIYIPNTFTPSKDDGKNDVFNVQGMGFLADTFEMTIYDRWGHIVFKTNDVYKGWDGSVKGGPKAQQGVYVYKIKLKDFKLRDKEFVGHITLL